MHVLHKKSTQITVSAIELESYLTSPKASIVSGIEKESKGLHMLGEWPKLW